MLHVMICCGSTSSVNVGPAQPAEVSLGRLLGPVVVLEGALPVVVRSGTPRREPGLQRLRDLGGREVVLRVRFPLEVRKTRAVGSTRARCLIVRRAGGEWWTSRRRAGETVQTLVGIGVGQDPLVRPARGDVGRHRDVPTRGRVVARAGGRLRQLTDRQRRRAELAHDAAQELGQLVEVVDERHVDLIDARDRPDVTVANRPSGPEIWVSRVDGSARCSVAAPTPTASIRWPAFLMRFASSTARSMVVAVRAAPLSVLNATFGAGNGSPGWPKS